MSFEADEVELIKQRKMAEMMDKMNSISEKNSPWPAEPVPVNDSGFDGFVRKYSKVVIDCWAPWCGPCRMLSPTIEALARDMTGKVAFGKLNTDENFQVSHKYGISGIPTLLLFKEGKLVDKMVGAAPRSMVEQKIKKALG